MGKVIGMDEAGYGPNLGPLVVTATAWDIESHPAEFDFWSLLESAVSQTAPKQPGIIHVADSKQVYTPAKGIKELEKSVLCLLRLLGQTPATFQDLWSFLTRDTKPVESQVEPWFENADLPLPQVASPDDIEEAARSKVSFMPEGVLAGLTAQEAADLLAYIQSLNNTRQ